MENEKTCNVCNVTQPLTEFYFRKELSKYRDNCKKCKPVKGRKFWAERTSKICKICGVEKELSLFNKATGGTSHQSYCRECDCERKKTYLKDNADKVKHKRQIFYQANREVIIKRGAQRQKDTKDALNAYRRERYKKKKDDILAQAKARRASKRKVLSEEEIAAKKKASKDRKRESKRIWCNMKSATDITFKILKRLRGRTRFALKRNGAVKSATTEELLGCTIPEFRDYFESLFTEGMSWELFLKGEIHVDHKKPCIDFDLSDPQQQKECFFYKNLQPLWWLHNLQKGTKNHEEWQKQ